jgi:hypothetical protein
MGFLNVVKNVVTLGGHGRLQDAINRNEQLRLHHVEVHDRASALKKRLDFRVWLLGKTASMSLKRLHRSRRFLNAVAGYRLRSISATLDVPLPRVQGKACQGQLSVIPTEGRIAAGSLVGYASVSGSWALMTMLGTASTGTALSTLSGAAAYSSTMAAFGGGSLAAGGLGVAGGVWVLTGIAVIPALAFAAWSTRSKANEVDADSARVQKATDELSEVADKIMATGTVSEYSRLLILAAWSHMERCDRTARRLIWPWGVLSRLWCWISGLFGGSQLDIKQNTALMELDAAVFRYSALFAKVDS